MPLSVLNVTPGNGVKAADVAQFYNLFTGVMTDQPITFKNTLRVGGNQTSAAVPFRVDGVAAQSARMVELYTLAGDTQPVFGVDKAGLVSWGAGGGTATDTTLTRSGVNALTLSGSLTIATLGLTVTAGGVTVTAGGLVVTAGGGTITAGGLTVTAGNVGIGAAPSTTFGLLVTGNIFGAATSLAGISSVATAPATATVAFDAIQAQAATVASAFTVGYVSGLTVYDAVKGNTSTITTQYGVFIRAQTRGGTNNYGLYIEAPSGGGGVNYGLVNLGISYLQGAIIVGAPANPALTGPLRFGNNTFMTWRNVVNDGDLTFGVDSSNRLTMSVTAGSGWLTATTVGATGGASALPANPLGYLRVVLNGAVVVWPYYNS